MEKPASAPAHSPVPIQAPLGWVPNPAPPKTSGILQHWPQQPHHLRHRRRMAAALLSAAVHAPVVDRTGLTGLFNVDLSFAPDNSTNSNLPSFFTAVEEQLGLKLQPEKVSVDTVVVDHVDTAPTPN